MDRILVACRADRDRGFTLRLAHVPNTVGTVRTHRSVHVPDMGLDGSSLARCGLDARLDALYRVRRVPATHFRAAVAWLHRRRERVDGSAQGELAAHAKASALCAALSAERAVLVVL